MHNIKKITEIHSKSISRPKVAGYIILQTGVTTLGHVTHGTSYCGLAIPTFSTACSWRTCRDACWDRELTVSFEVGGGENVPGIPGAWATRNFKCLVRGPWKAMRWSASETWFWLIIHGLEINYVKLWDGVQLEIQLCGCYCPGDARNQHISRTCTLATYVMWLH